MARIGRNLRWYRAGEFVLRSSGRSPPNVNPCPFYRLAALGPRRRAPAPLRSRSARMRSSRTDAGSSLGSWGTSLPSKARFRMDWRRRWARRKFRATSSSSFSRTDRRWLASSTMRCCSAKGGTDSSGTEPELGRGAPRRSGRGLGKAIDARRTGSPGGAALRIGAVFERRLGARRPYSGSVVELARFRALFGIRPGSLRSAPARLRARLSSPQPPTRSGLRPGARRTPEASAGG